MVAIPAKDAATFVKSGFSAFSLILIFGPDEGMVSERATAIALATTGGDSGNILRLDGDEIASDPLRLADEANSISMFGGVRAIRVKAGGKSIIAALEPLIAAPPIDARIIIEAGDIKANHSLRALIEKTRISAAIACYAEDVRDIGALLDGMLAEAGMTATSDARQALSSLLGVDRKRSRAEIDKLFLYCHGQKTIGVDDVEAIVTDAAALSADSVIDAVYLGKLDTIELEARRVFADGMDPGVLLGFALRHAFLLQSINQEKGNGRTVSESIKSRRVSWKREKVVAEQSSRWVEARLERAIQILGDAVLNIRRNGPIAEALAIRSLWSLALSARR
jgi:DNA polymerase III subunit delta